MMQGEQDDIKEVSGWTKDDTKQTAKIETFDKESMKRVIFGQRNEIERK